MNKQAGVGGIAVHGNGTWRPVSAQATRKALPSAMPMTTNSTDEDQQEGRDLLTDAQLADRWQLSRGTLANQRSQGRGPAYLKIAGRVRYRRSDIDAYEQAGRVETTANSHAALQVASRESIDLLLRSIGA